MELSYIWSVFVSWLPMILIMGAWFIFASFHSRKQRLLIVDATNSNNDLVIANRELTAEIRELKSVLKDKK